MEFWNSQLTEKSWKMLHEINKKYNFILIGGWAVYLLTKQQKSKDIDIIVSINELQRLKNEDISKNDKLKKYEIKTGEIDIDIYVEYYSKLAIPSEELKKYTLKIHGFNVLLPEALLILKQGAEIDRQNSVKGEKDKIDIISLLFFSEIDFNYKEYLSILKKYSKQDYAKRLLNIIREFNDYNSLGFSPRHFKLKKKEVVEKLRKIKF